MADAEKMYFEYCQKLCGTLIHQKFQHEAPEILDNSSNGMTFGQSNTCLPEQMQSAVQVARLSAAPRCQTLRCRQFWKAGNNDNVSSESLVLKTKNLLHVHPKFLHSNATSHKWAFGAVAELLDNAIDEIQNGATFVMVDEVSDPRDKGPALLIQDDGGGMDPGAIRRCMSFGFSDKMSKRAIGKYGNGFKTSTMRLGADALVFSRQNDSGKLTQSVGLLSYTHLCCTGMDRIVIPMVDYEYNMSTGTWEPLCHIGGENFHSNMSIILQWSPYSTEAELLKQFDNFGSHGTKIIIYNLWFADDGKLELDFVTDPKDIRLKSSQYMQKDSRMLINEEHMGNQYHYSLRVYLSILYLQLPQNFSIILRGKVVEHHSIARDLRFPEFIVYRPFSKGTKEGDIMTTIGFLKEAPDVNIHGFNVYHKNRLILPFWQVASYSNGRGRGVLEANFAEPIHNKQDFERTSLFQRLETRLKSMTCEYWDHHCGLIGYQVQSKTPVSLPYSPFGAVLEPVTLTDPADEAVAVLSLPVGSVSRREGRRLDVTTTKNRLLPALTENREIMVTLDATTTQNFTGTQLATFSANERNQQEVVLMMQENKDLQEKCLGYMKREKEFVLKISLLKKDLEEERNKYDKMLSQVEELEAF
ncbi:hypothetical protein BVRB_5g117380 isoform A [Beta vulgaris subsp. vulgaris]|nr:hypothetical protein BVRB_5g117380 isoform A [Beta vulgaris subsp. vulgaris]